MSSVSEAHPLMGSNARCLNTQHYKLKPFCDVTDFCKNSSVQTIITCLCDDKLLLAIGS